MEHTRIAMPRRAHARRCLFAAIALACGACNEVTPAETEELGTAQQALGGYSYTDHRAWSQSPPGGLSASQVPMFVQIGFDDNQRSGLNTTPASGMTWATDFFRTLRNPAGTGQGATFDNSLVRVSFYSNATYISSGFVEDPVLVKRSWHTALVDGHEIGNHTFSHLDGGAFTVAQWTNEIGMDTDWLTRAFVANEPAFSQGSGPGVALINLIGFRTPFLSYNDNTMTSLVNQGFTYDISIEEGWQLSDDGTNFNWPYTLDNASPGGTAVGRPVANHSGLWELGAAPFVMPASLRTQLGLTKITGLDYNMFVSLNLTKAQVLTILKYDLDQRLANNRAPFFVGAHTNIYTGAVALTNSTPQERREAIQEFVTYALTKPQVRIVTAKDMLTWLRNPVALGGGCTPESNTTFCSRLGKNCGSVTANDNCGTSRTVNPCGTCTSPQTCGGGGTANVCGGGTSADRTEGGTATGTGTACNTSTETVAKAYDNLMTSGNFTKWCVTSAPSTSVPISTAYDFSGTTAFAINSYTITTGNDAATRDPKNWTFQGCQGSCTVGSDTGWTTLDTRTNQFAGSARFQTTTFSFTNSTAYQQFRLRVTANNGDTSRVQMTEIQMFDSGSCTPESNTAFCSRLGKNCGSVTANDNCGTSRTVNPCGTCTSPQTCGGGGTANVCGGGGGSCNPTVTSYTLAKCNSTAVFNAKMYKCISQAAGVNGEPTGCGTAGVFCSNIPPTDPTWGTTAWQFLQDCP
jgi:peptidoglycan/xylan/chitin deacetylase (PgdA/CDA1 family)